MTQAYVIEVLRDDGTPYARRMFVEMAGLEPSRADAEARLAEIRKPGWDRYSQENGCLTTARLRIVEVTIGGKEDGQGI